MLYYYKIMSNQIEKLYIDSRDRQTGQKSDDFTVSIGNFRQLSGLTSLYVDSMVFPNSLYPINSNNNKLYLQLKKIQIKKNKFFYQIKNNWFLDYYKNLNNLMGHKAIYQIKMRMGNKVIY